MTVRRSGEALDVEAAGHFGSQPRGKAEVEIQQPPIARQVAKQTGVRLAYGLHLYGIVGEGDAGGEEAVAVEAGLASGVASVRGDPVNAVTDTRGPFEVRFGRFARDPQEGIEVDAQHRQTARVPAIDAQDIVLVVGDDKEV